MSQERAWVVKVRRFGGSLVVDVPKEVMAALELNAGDLIQWVELPGRRFALHAYNGATSRADVDDNIPRRLRRIGEMLALARLRPLQIREFNSRALFRNGYHERVREEAVSALFASAHERIEKQSRRRSSTTTAELDGRINDGEDVSDFSTGRRAYGRTSRCQKRTTHPQPGD